MKFGRYVIIDDGGNYVTFHELNVRIKIKKNNKKSAVTTAPRFLLCTLLKLFFSFFFVSYPIAKKV